MFFGDFYFDGIESISQILVYYKSDFKETSDGINKFTATQQSNQLQKLNCFGTLFHSFYAFEINRQPESMDSTKFIRQSH